MEYDLEVAQQVLDKANEYGLCAEVFTFSIIAMRNNPELTIQQAMICGLDEWVK